MLEELVQKYIEALDSGDDDLAVYEQIRRLSKELSQTAFWETAEVARILYYRRKAQAHEPELLTRLDTLLDSVRKSDELKGRTLGEYFSNLIAHLRLNWPSILREMGISPNQSSNFARSIVPLTALLGPDKVAWLAKRLQADAGTVMRLARQELETQLLPAEPLGSVSYRVLRDFSAPSDAKPEAASDEEKMFAYLSSLECALKAHSWGPG